MCIVCRHNDRIAIEAHLRAGRSIRDVAADYDLGKSVLGEHRKHHMASTPLPSVAPQSTIEEGPGTPTPDAAPQSLPAVRRRTRPMDEAQRLSITLRMRARRASNQAIASAIKCSPAHVSGIIRRATSQAIAETRNQTLDELVAEHMALRHHRVGVLSDALDAAVLRNDAKAIVEITRELRHESKEDREWMDRIGALDTYRRASVHHREKAPGQEDTEDLISMFKQVVSAVGAGDFTHDDLADDEAPQLLADILTLPTASGSSRR